jgi:hypothetical protein
MLIRFADKDLAFHENPGSETEYVIIESDKADWRTRLTFTRQSPLLLVPPTSEQSLASIATSLESIAAQRIPLDELRTGIEDIYESDGLTAEDIAAMLLQRYDIRER